MVYYTIDYVAAQTEIDSMEWFGQMALSAGDRIPNQVGKESISHMKRVSIADVAKVAGVSVATVSNALNGKGRVGADTAKKIKEIAEELGYTPSLAAQAMSRKRVKIGIFIYQLQFGIAIYKLFIESVAMSRLIICIRDITDSHRFRTMMATYPVGVR